MLVISCETGRGWFATHPLFPSCGSRDDLPSLKVVHQHVGQLPQYINNTPSNVNDAGAHQSREVKLQAARYRKVILHVKVVTFVTGWKGETLA